jgi:hypothetical protein
MGLNMVILTIAFSLISIFPTKTSLSRFETFHIALNFGIMTQLCGNSGSIHNKTWFFGTNLINSELALLPLRSLSGYLFEDQKCDIPNQHRKLSLAMCVSF